MRQIRLLALAFISFVATIIASFLSPGTFLHRALSVATCTVFSFNSTLCAANLVRWGDRVVAANPPAVVAQGNACGSGTVTQQTMQRGNDGTMYQVYYDFRRGQETVNSAACGREYWISPNSKHRLYGIRFVYLVNGQRNRVVPTLYYETVSGGLKVYDNNVAAARLPNPFSPDLGIASNPNPSRPQVNRPNASQSTQAQSRPEPNKPNLTGGSTSNVPCNPTLQTASAQPAKEVIVKGVPTSFTDLIARVNVDGSNELFPTVARRLDNGDVAVATPLHPTNGAAGGNVQITLSSGDATCPALSLRINPLSPAPGTTQRTIAKVGTFADKITNAFGVSRAELMGNPKNLPQEAVPLYAMQYLLDHPNNPNSLKAILAGTAPVLKGERIDTQTLDGIIANIGLNERLDGVSNKITVRGLKKAAETALQYERETAAIQRQLQRQLQTALDEGQTTTQIRESLSRALQQRAEASNASEIAKQNWQSELLNKVFDSKSVEDKTKEIIKKMKEILANMGLSLTVGDKTAGDQALGSKIQAPPIFFSPVTLYGETNRSLKYLSVKVYGQTIQNAEDTYKSIKIGSSDLVVSPKFGSIHGSCEQYEDNKGNKTTVQHSENIMVKDKDDPKPQPQKTGNSYGDPHMITFDGFKYSFQTVGEFTLVKSTTGNFEVQARQGAISNSVSMNTAVAMKIGNSRVALYAKNPPDDHTSTPLRVDGKPTKLENGTLELPGGGKIQGNSSYYLVTAPTGEQVGINLGNGRMDIKPYISGQSGQYIGLLGNANGNPTDDLQTRGGKVIPTKENSTYGQVSQALRNVLPVPAPLNQAEKLFFDVVYKEFGDSWRISQAESLFDYPPGKDTGTFTNRSFPNSYLSLNSLLPPQIRKAEVICRQAGVESELMDGCIFDVGQTGDASFAQSAANALLDTAKDRLLQQLRNRVPVPPVPVPFKIPGIRF